MMYNKYIAMERKWHTFQYFKTAIYLLLLIDTLYFMANDYMSAAHTFKQGIELADIGNAFATFMDSFAWFILLIIFEAETYILNSTRLTSRKKLFLTITGALCYFFIIIAFFGYWDKLQMIEAFDAVPIKDLCAIAKDNISLAIGFDDYVPLTAENCTDVSGQLYLNAKNAIYASSSVLQEMYQLAGTDVINAGTWILVVIMLQIEIMLQITGKLTNFMYKINSITKLFAYFILFMACIYWGYLGDFIAFWDALLWLVAFFFIEMNIFQWRQPDNKIS